MATYRKNGAFLKCEILRFGDIISEQEWGGEGELYSELYGICIIKLMRRLNLTFLLSSVASSFIRCIVVIIKLL